MQSIGKNAVSTKGMILPLFQVTYRFLSHGGEAARQSIQLTS
jgi:hypothetical protein